MKKTTKLGALNKKGFKIFKEIVCREHEVCEACLQEPVSTAHHFYPQGSYGYLRYHLPNGIAIGVGCHFAHHTKGDPQVHLNIIKRRGEKWLKELEEAKRQKPPKYGTVKWVKEEIERMESLL